MSKLPHGRLLKLFTRSPFHFRCPVEIMLCRLPQESCRYAHTQSAGQLTDDEEEELVRNLVQDAFNPSRAANKCSVSGSFLSDMRQDISSTDPALSEHRNVNEFQVAAAGGCSGSLGVLQTTETDSRASNTLYEKFARVRLSSHAYTVEELRKISNREANIEWMCMHCQTFNFMGRKLCRHCGVSEVNSHRERHPPTRYVVSFPTSWICEECRHLNNATEVSGSNPTPASVFPFEALPRSTTQKHRAKFFCAQCSKPFGGAREWYCPYCDHVNSKASTQCSTCFAERPVRWKCSECGHASNSIFSTACYTCKQRRPMKVSNSTMLCPNCGARNDCRWELCEACMSPLPAMIELVENRRFDRQAASVLGRFPLPVTNPVPVASQQRTSGSQTGKVRNYLQEGSPAEPYIVSAATFHRSPPTSAETSGSWWCIQCNIIQRRNATFCDVCLRPRHLADETADSSNSVGSVRASVSEGGDKGNHSTRDPLKLPPMGSWQCPYCRHFKDAKELRCCGKMRGIRRGYWLCQRCSSVNRREREVCIGCGMPPALEERHWTCVVCELDNAKGSLLCQRCGTEHPSFWCCASCHLTVSQPQVFCPACKAAKPDVPAPIVCPVCQAPNAPVRLACFRCRARLQLSWQCTRCQAIHQNRTLVRCPACHAPHVYNEAEETWVCELCASAIASGGDLPVRQQCPKCHADRVPECLSFPSRWRCTRCGIFNRTVSPQCVECGAARCMPATFHATVTCPQCFGQTEANTKEKCTNCGFSLSGMLTVAAAEVHISPALTAPSCCGTDPHEFSAGLSVDAASLPYEHNSSQGASRQTSLSDSISSEGNISCTQL